MASTSQSPKGRDGALSALDVLITALSVAKDTCGVPPAQIALGSAVALLTMIRDSMSNEQDYVELGTSCGDVCQALDRGLNGRRLDELNQPVLGAIGKLTTTVADIQMNVVKRGKRNVASRLFHAKTDKDSIAAWKQELNTVLHIFNTELLINNNMMLLDLHRNALAGQEGASGRRQPTKASITKGELPPPPPACFGRAGLIKKIVGLAENLKPIALIGAGGIGKSSIALSVLHNNRIKKRFGDNRRFIRCNEFPASRTNFLSRLSEVIGAGVKNPKGLAPLRSFLTSREMFIILDNAESILDPQGKDARGIYTVVDELCQFETISICITSRITTVPRHCKRPEIPTLSMKSACGVFYGIYGDSRQSNIVNDLVRRLDFHALSITLLATAASRNGWDYDRLANEWDIHRAQVLRTDFNESLAAAIELSLASPTFRKLGPDARDLLGVVAFFPQGVDEKNIDWLFPTISDRKNILDQFCVLSLAYRRNGFITTLAPLRDYLSPHDPKSSSLLCATRDHYFTRLSANVDPSQPGFKEAQWITSEDVNVEHLLGAFATTGEESIRVWIVCIYFIKHLYWHKPRETVLRSKIEGLPDDHRFKSSCLSELSSLFELVGNHAERKQLLTRALTLERERGRDIKVALTLRELSDANGWLGLQKEGIQQAKEASEIYERLGKKKGQAQCLNDLARLLLDDKQFDPAVAAASRAIDLIKNLKNDDRHIVCQSHRLLGQAYHSKKEKEKAILHFKTALEIASRFDWQDQLFWIHHALASLFLDERNFDDALAHVKQAKSHTDEDQYNLGCAMEMQAEIWFQQHKLKETKSEVLGALKIFKKLGSAEETRRCKDLLQRTNKAIKNKSTNSKRK